MAPFFLVFSKKSLDQLSLEQNFSFSLEGGDAGALPQFLWSLLSDFSGSTPAFW